MNDHDSQLKLQAYLDGELSEREAREVAKHLAQDQESVLLLAELRHTREALRQGQAPMQLPESREFYWSKIERQIQREAVPAPKPERAGVPAWLTAWRRVLVPAGAVAAVALVFMLSQGSNPAHLQAALADSGTFTYRDFNSGSTLVWLSYPAENEFAEGAAAGTLQ